jgi:phospholipid/cholesterol/gamma-HCH transport system substrate-binding protein
MKRKAVPLLRIGAFVLVAFIVLVVFIFYIGNKEKMFSSTTDLKARFSTVSNLRRGAEIDLAGINVGSVNDIRLPNNSRDSVTVTMKVLTDVLKLIHTDSKAVISTQGLIGDKVIFISMGGDSTKAVEPGSTIQGVVPQDFSKIFDTMSAAVSQFDSLAKAATLLVRAIQVGHGTLAKLVNDDSLYQNANGMVSQAKQTLASANDAIGHISQNFDKTSSDLNGIVEQINRGEGSLGKLLKSDDLYQDLRKTTESVANSTDDLHDALAKIALGSGRFAEVMEGMKHNFLVKGYFEDRGYWDAPEFEMTIDRKIDSLNKLRQMLDNRQKLNSKN